VLDPAGFIPVRSEAGAEAVEAVALRQHGGSGSTCPLRPAASFGANLPSAPLCAAEARRSLMPIGDHPWSAGYSVTFSSPEQKHQRRNLTQSCCGLSCGFPSCGNFPSLA
jgi:hypothetical protein